jgi:hypothetical protein
VISLTNENGRDASGRDKQSGSGLSGQPNSVFGFEMPFDFLEHQPQLRNSCSRIVRSHARTRSGVRIRA